ncbi:MAG: hypothetical protein QOI53_2850 [Verrucomicrobiota bacterium]|nr:hypothetical protein [Verrucomicrobiota bacterium]
MLRMRLSLDCGWAAVATEGVSDNLFTIESLANKVPITLKRTRATGNRGVCQSNLRARVCEPGPKVLEYLW